MNPFFTVLSIIYVIGIFLLAGSPFISKIAIFNLFSLLHIPLYGILTVFLVFSFIPLPHRRSYAINQTNQRNQRNQKDQIDQKDRANRFLFAGLIALGVAVADEVHQTYIPGRDGSIADVLLDFVGIVLVLFFTFRLLKKKHR